MEIALSLAFITAGTIVFFLAVYFLPIFPKLEQEPEREPEPAEAVVA
jgi:hypothetical protein